MTTGGRKRLREVIRLVQPETVLKWHRALVRRKWTYAQRSQWRTFLTSHKSAILATDFFTVETFWLK